MDSDNGQWAISLDDFALVRGAFSGGVEHCDEVLRQALQQNTEMLNQVNDIIQKVRLRDPHNRKNPDPAHPVTPAEIILDDTSLRLLMRFAKSAQEGLMKVHGRALSNQDNLDQIQEILKKARLRAPILKRKPGTDHQIE